MTIFFFFNIFFYFWQIQKATAKINYLKKDYAKLDAMDREKIDKLKKQYYEHKMLWETVHFNRTIKYL